MFDRKAYDESYLGSVGSIYPKFIGKGRESQRRQQEINMRHNNESTTFDEKMVLDSKQQCMGHHFGSRTTRLSGPARSERSIQLKTFSGVHCSVWFGVLAGQDRSALVGHWGISEVWIQVEE